MFSPIAQAYFVSVQAFVNQGLNFVSFFTERGFNYSIRNGTVFHGTARAKVRAVKKLILDSGDCQHARGVMVHWREVEDVPFGISLEQLQGEELCFKTSRTYMNGWIQDWYICSQSSLMHHFLPPMIKRPVMLVFETHEFQCKIFLESVCRVPGTVLVQEMAGFEKILKLLDDHVIPMADFANLTLALIGLQVQRSKPLRVLVSYPSLMRGDVLDYFSHHYPNVRSACFESPARSIIKIGIKSQSPRNSICEPPENTKQSFLLLRLKAWLKTLLTDENDSRSSHNPPTNVSFVFSLIVKLEELCLRPALVISRFLRAFNVFLEHAITVLEHFIAIHRPKPDPEVLSPNS